MKRIAIIPARGGSKRMQDKNIRDFCSRPMISYTLQTAKESKLFDVIHVSTDSERTAQIVTQLGFSVDFMRPMELADDQVPIMPVLKYVLETYHKRGIEFEEVALIMAFAPLLEVEDLIQASKLKAENSHQKNIIGVAKYPVAVEWAFKRNEDGTMLPVQPGMFSVRSQDLDVKYFDTGLFCFLSAGQVLSSEGAGTDNEFLGQILPRYKAVDIDEPEDWLLAEALYTGLKNIQNIR